MTSPWMYAARRVLLAVPLLLGMSMLVFALMRLVPGDPAVVVLGYKATPEGVRALREAFHLDEPLPEQYARWLAGLLRVREGSVGLLVERFDRSTSGRGKPPMRLHQEDACQV